MRRGGGGGIRWVAAVVASGLALVLMTSAGCSAAASGPPSSPGTPTAGAAGGRTEKVSVGDRPVTLYVPSSYRAGAPLPLVILLHGYTSSGRGQESYLKITPEADKRGFLYATPDGTVDRQGNRFWNATDACCNFYASQVDDSAFLTILISTISASYAVDAKRVYLAGHSNGAFMAYRMACEHADLIAGIAALNGAMWSDPSRCSPARPVSVLHIRGTDDATILNNGGQIAGHAYPSTTATVADWLTLDGCAAAADTASAPLDLEASVAGAETTVARYPGCRGGVAVELWTITGGGHIPSFTPTFVPAVFDFLLAHTLSP